MSIDHTTRPERNSKSGKGLRKHPLYKIWMGIRRRCFSPLTPNFHNYGGRGISMFQEWADDFLAFFDHVSQLPNFGKVGYSLDRIDNNGHYEPGNVRWATRLEQARNSRIPLQLTHNGETKTLPEWAEEIGVLPDTLHKRLLRGMPLEVALTTSTLRLGQYARRPRPTLTFNGRTQTYSEWAKEYNLPADTLSRRLRKGVPPEIALTTPTSPDGRSLRNAVSTP